MGNFLFAKSRARLAKLFGNVARNKGLLGKLVVEPSSKPMLVLSELMRDVLWPFWFRLLLGLDGCIGKDGGDIELLLSSMLLLLVNKFAL